MADPLEARFSATFAAVSASGVVAMSAGYVTGDDAPVIKITGPRFKGSQQMLAADARWHIGSISKSFTATLLMRMAERGEIDFNAPLAALLPEYAADMHADWRDLTLTEILSHTAGLRPNFTQFQMAGTQGDDLTAARLKLLTTYWSKPLPGVRGRFVYSNLGYVLAGFIAETRSDTPWQDLIRRDIAAPLGLTSLGFGAPMGATDPWDHKQSFFITRPVDPRAARSDNPAWLGPAGTLPMSLTDLLCWGRAHMQACRGEMQDFLSAAACARLHTPIAENYALGWLVLPFAGLDQPIQTHNGSNSMWVAELAYSSERDMVLALALNTGGLAKAEAGLWAFATALLAPESAKP